MVQEEFSSSSPPLFLKKNSPHLPFCAAWSIETEVPVSNLESALSNYLVIASLSHLIDAEIKGPDPSKWKYSHKNRKHVGEPSLKWGKWNICRRAAWLSDNNIWSRMQYQYFCGSNWLTTICSSKLEQKCIIRVFLTVFFQYHTASTELSHMEKFFKKYVSLAATHCSFQSWNKAGLVRKKNILYKHRAQKHSIIWSNFSVFG